MTNGEHDHRSSTHSAEAIRALLRDASAEGLYHTLRAPQGYADLLAQMCTVAVRRRFAKETDVRAITRYVTEALPRQQMTAGGRLARETEALIRSILGEKELRDGIPQTRLADIMSALVVDLAQTQHLTTEEIEKMITEAESRVLRYGKGHRASHPRRGLLARLGMRRNATAASETETT